VLALAPDLLFSSRIGETARRLGLRFRVARSVEDFRTALAEAPDVILVDLTASALDLARALQAAAETPRAAPVIGWTTHVLWKATTPLHAACTRVVTREQLTAELPELLQRHVAAAAPARGA
jgi:CheY-like chemotaxis protein